MKMFDDGIVDEGCSSQIDKHGERERATDGIESPGSESEIPHFRFDPGLFFIALADSARLE